MWNAGLFEFILGSSGLRHFLLGATHESEMFCVRERERQAETFHDHQTLIYHLGGNSLLRKLENLKESDRGAVGIILTISTQNIRCTKASPILGNKPNVLRSSLLPSYPNLQEMIP